MTESAAAIEVTATGQVRVRTGKVELGQGLHSALAQIVADALGIALADVQMLAVDTDWSPDQGVTSGSLSIQDGGQALRQACAALAPADLARLRRGAPTRLGDSPRRHDLPALFAGQPHFIHDLALPGMLHGRVLHPPQPGAQVLAWRSEERRVGKECCR